jgi:hypothetical protein
MAVVVTVAMAAQTTTKMVGAGKNQQNVAVASAVAETAVMETAIVAAGRRWGR